MRPAFKVGDIIRYGTGKTALMKITLVKEDYAGPGQHRYWGDQFYGSGVGAYHNECKPATVEEKALWDVSHCGAYNEA